ncbi:MAG: tRNA (guanosine(46)-N7)-methyltransferase TrmB [Cyanobacterium sp. T60_A2020_053]|nr:tRNA (guanosine(46)-N7)-methyltransferase TrmB [Cyanobacterium sp. T60_A2020_053]
MARIRLRQHVNPLSIQYQRPSPLPDWADIYQDLSLPLYIDIGCARGHFIAQMAQIETQINFLGIEIRRALVTEANQWRDDNNLTNLHYLFANLNHDLKDLLQSLPCEKIKMIMVQFPDPWFKKKHQKRRVIQPEIIDIFAQYLPNECQIFLQSDIKEVAEEMAQRFLSHPRFSPQHPDIWLKQSPFAVKTEREIATENKHQPVYRTLIRVR